MPISRHQFAQLDSDSDLSLKAASSFDSALNISLEPGYITAVAGNVAVPYALPPTGDNVRLGGFEDGSTGTAVSLLYNSLGAHRLIRYDPLGNGGLGSETTLLEWAGLNLAADTVVQGGVIDDLLLYLDATGAVRLVNLKRALSGLYTPALLLSDPYALHLVKQPPAWAPDVSIRVAADSSNAQSVSRAGTNLLAGHAWQFAVQYEYLDSAPTPLGPYSEISFSPVNDIRNLLRVGMITPSAALAPTGYVTSIVLCARKDDETGWGVVSRLRRDATNAFPVYFDFFGETTGEVLTASEAAKQAEALPPVVNALTIGHSRPLVGDCREGGPAPVVSLAVTCGAAPTPSPVTVPIYTVTTTYTGTTQGPDGQTTPVEYTETAVWVHTGGPDYGTGNQGDGTYDTVALAGAVYQRRGNPQPFLVAFPDNSAVSISQGSLSPVLATIPGMTAHALARYRVGLRFYDAQGRPSPAGSVVSVFVPPSPGTPQSFYWTLGSTSATALNAEIPADAYSYQLLLSRNYGASWFKQLGLETPKLYLGVDSTDKDRPLVALNGNTGGIPVKAVYLDITGAAYVFEPGDRVRFIGAAARALNLDFAITGQKGNYLAIEAQAAPRLLSIIASLTPVVVGGIELYTPITTSEGDSESLFERGPRLAVLRTVVAGVEHRSYAAQTGAISGDAFLLVDSTGDARESPTPLGREGSWLDASRGGRPAFTVAPATTQAHRKALIRYGGVNVTGTQLNGMSQWEALNQFDELPQEQGAITRLTVADQTQTDGSILLVNQERGDVSLSLGQARLQTADGNDLLTQTKSVIGGANALRGGYGCTDPASVVEYAGKVFFWCARRAELLRYDRNGLTPLGITYKARVRLEQLARDYAGVRVRTCYDPRRKEAWLSFPATGSLPATTVVYSERREAWADALSYAPEAGLAVGNELVSWDAAVLYRHTPDAPAATFAGTYTAPQLTFSVAAPGGVAKLFEDIAVESPSLWLATQLSTDTQQQSRMLPPWFTFREGVYRTGLRRNEQSPGFPTIYHALNNGQPLIGSRLTVVLQAPAGAGPLTACSISFSPRSGQRMGD